VPAAWLVYANRFKSSSAMVSQAGPIACYCIGPHVSRHSRHRQVRRQALASGSVRGRTIERECDESQCMSPRSAQRFWDNDMHQNKDLKRVA
jgi:hypothetical protein